MYNKTKIIATIGPVSESTEVIEKMIQAGVDVFRLNLKHNTLEWHEETIKKIKKIAEKMNVNVGTLADMQGPEIRIRTKDENGIQVLEGDIIYIGDDFNADPKSIKLVPEKALATLEIGDEVFIDNGNLPLKIVDKVDGYLHAEASRDYFIKNKKAMNAPGKSVNLPLFSQADIDAFAMVKKAKPDFVGLSFVRSGDDVREMRKELNKINSNAKIIVKVENMQALDNIEEIVEETDVVMVARGDLGVEVPMRELAYWQKKIIKLCREKNRPVIVATQMLLSMVDNFNPTRSEATDVANAVLDGTDVLMLSDETTIGKYPVRVVKEMASIASFSEHHNTPKPLDKVPHSPTEILIHAAANIIENTKSEPIKAAIVFTQSGATARLLATYRLNVPMIAVTNDEDVAKSLSLSYSILPYVIPVKKDKFDIHSPLFKDLTKLDLLNEGDRVIVVHGSNWIEAGDTTNISLITL